ncbi:hypothetical protein F4604DRAFT_1915296 [Suillus subluteus]|nr:hypothetical protein F4604DRAFT_1915296 [Suillus subluteus]
MHNSNVQELNRRLIQCCANSLSQEQEFSTPEVISYLMGWGDQYISHHFEMIYWNAVVSLLKKTYPQLCKHQSHVLQHTSEGETANVSDCHPQTEYAVLEIYEENFNYLEYFLNTYDVHVTPEDIDTVLKRNDCHLYLAYKEGTSHTGHICIVRHDNHDVIPHIPGQWFPHADNLECHPFYCASMLALLTPWRDIIQLKKADESFISAFKHFMVNASPSSRDIVNNIQYFHECSDKAKERESVSQTTYHEPVNSH